MLGFSELVGRPAVVGLVALVLVIVVVKIPPYQLSSFFATSAPSFPKSYRQTSSEKSIPKAPFSAYHCAAK